MTEGDSSIICEQCGNPIQRGDQFCGNCGAAILPPPPEAEQIVPEPLVPQSPPTSTRRPLLLIGGIGLLLVLLVGTGAFALVSFNSGTGLFGGSDPDPTDTLNVPSQEDSEEPVPPPEPTEPTDTETTQMPSVSPDAPPDPAFDNLLPTLQTMTDAPIMLPADLPEELESIGINDPMEEDRYGLTFLNTPPEELTGGWAMAETVGSLDAVPESEYEPNQQFEVVSTEDVDLPDGTEATLRYMQPVSEMAMFGSRWEGTFDKDGHTYTLWVRLGQNGEEITRQALSSMVLVPDAVKETTEEETIEDPSTEDQFISDYYEAVDNEDWYTTYSMLSEESQAEFTEEEWVQAQQVREASSPLPPIESATLSNSQGDALALTTDVILTHDDGSETTIEGVVIFDEDMGLKRYLTEGEVEYLRGLIEDDGSEETAIEDAIRSHYEAIGENDFEGAYSYFGPTFRSTSSEESWVAEEESQGITDSTINSVDVVSVDGDTAEASVDVSFEDSSGSPSFLLEWSLVKEDGLWKLDEILDGEQTN